MGLRGKPVPMVSPPITWLYYALNLLLIPGLRLLKPLNQSLATWLQQGWSHNLHVSLPREAMLLRCMNHLHVCQPAQG